MAIKTVLWNVATTPHPVMESELVSERQLEDMIVAAPALLSDEWLLIGRQEDTGFGGRIDLLAIAPDASLVLIEIKRNRTPRDVVAQALDYASWVAMLQPSDISAMYRRFGAGADLAEDFKSKFGRKLDEDDLNLVHQIVIVASSLDPSTERIVNYLGERGFAINVLCFQVFDTGAGQLISRAWLHDPSEVQVAAAAATSNKSEPWNGEFYHSFGDDESRSWSDAVKFGFICGGGGAWYSNTLKQVSAGDRVWVNIPGKGYVGVGRALGPAVPARDFMLGEKNILDMALLGTYHRDFVGDDEHCEWFVPMKWLDTVSVPGAIKELGFFGNQNTLCRPITMAWRKTVERLKVHFPAFDVSQP